MLWFALYLNGLPLEAWLVACASDSAANGPDDLAARPCCVVEAKRVVQADVRAAAAGVEPGMSVATASSLAAGLHVFTRDAVRESAQVERLALSLARFTPAVMLQRDGVLLEVSACLRLFGGARALWRAVRDSVRVYRPAEK